MRYNSRFFCIQNIFNNQLINQNNYEFEKTSTKSQKVHYLFKTIIFNNDLIISVDPIDRRKGFEFDISD